MPFPFPIFIAQSAIGSLCKKKNAGPFGTSVFLCSSGAGNGNRTHLLSLEG